MVFLVEDIDAEAERLRLAGVTIVKGPVDRAWGHLDGAVEDPDGFVVELAVEIPRQPSEGATVAWQTPEPSEARPPDPPC